ncbi:MAG: hypothetical protein IPM07_03875 [Anaerolineales bacterium]|nr:hypothetical protein [Anaerolineales bacterium]
MVYCNNQWISAYTYEAIRNRLVSENAAAALASNVDAPLADYLVIQGSVTPAGPSATLDEIYRLTAPSALASSAPGAYAIRLIGAGGSVLANYPFTPRADTEAPDDLTKPLLVMEQGPLCGRYNPDSDRRRRHCVGHARRQRQCTDRCRHRTVRR